MPKRIWSFLFFVMLNTVIENCYPVSFVTVWRDTERIK